MAKKKTDTAGIALRGLEESGDRFADWAAQHAVLILSVIAAILAIAAATGLYLQHASNSREKAADALALATSQYRLAMGADPTGGEITEPANAELAVRTRTEYVARFVDVAKTHPKTPAGAVAWLEAGHLYVELGLLEEATASFSAARTAGGKRAIAALASTRLAALAEAQGNPAAAAAEYEAAAAIAAYPLRADALASAARCWVEAGDPERALAVFQRLETEYPDQIVEPQIGALIAELRIDR